MDDYARWEKALAGAPMDFGERGDPACGYYRNPTEKGMEAVAIWKDENGAFRCARNIYGNGAKMDADEIDELFGNCGRYPISYEMYVAVTEQGEAFPPLYQTKLRTKDIEAGVFWTESWARQFLATTDPENYDEHGEPREAREKIGGNEPPEELPPEQALLKRIDNLAATAKTYLDTIGGEPKTLEEANVVGGYANKFKDLANEAQKAHDAEKEPFLTKGREIDAKWFKPVRDKAEECRIRLAKIAKSFEDAENARIAERHRQAQEMARKAAEATERKSDEPVEVAPPPPPPEPIKVAMRGRAATPKVKLVTDLGAFLTYCAGLSEPPAEISDAAETIAKRFKAAKIKVPGMEGHVGEVKIG